MKIQSSEEKTKAIDFIPKKIAYKYMVFPYDFNENYIFIYKTKSLSSDLENTLRLITNKKIKSTIENKNFILDKIDEYYGETTINKALDSINDDNEFKKEEAFENIDSPIVQTVNSIFERAISKGASDIHIEPFQKEVRIRFRIDGLLKEYRRLPLDIYESILTRVKLLSNMDISIKRIPQDGKYIFEYYESNCDMRVSTIPTIFGEKVVIRILYKSKRNFSLEDLKLNEYEREKMLEILNHTSGLILIAGPTGSGKTTSLYSMINEINNDNLNIVSIEDPVEYTITNVNQINVNNKTGLTFSSGLRSILRQDPDIIIIGEIRDEETAQIAVRASTTGHLVISTIHTKNSIGTIQRLMNMNIKPYLLSDALLGVISQRLIRVNCNHCKKKNNNLMYGIEDQELIVDETKGEGCIACEYTGYKGRRALFEILPFDDSLRRHLLNNDFQALSEEMSSKKFIDLKERCLQMVNEKETTMEEFKKVYYSL